MPRKNDKRQQIMRAAEKLFSGKRFHEITMSDVARVAQVGKGTIYQYFEDKEDLFFQTLTSGFDEMCETLQGKVPRNAPFVEQLVHACATIDGFFAARRHLFEMSQVEDARMAAFKGKMREHWMAHHDKLTRTLATVMANGVAEGTVRAEYPPEMLATMLLGMVSMRARHLAHMPEPFNRLEATIDLFLNGVGKRMPAAGPPDGRPGLS
jgi:TetR/AcrR family fatty acid metabolism transcriptional regulator